MAKINKNFRNAKGQFISKKDAGYIKNYALKNDIEESKLSEYIQQLDPGQVKEKSKQGNPQTGKLNSRWRNSKGQLISYRDIQNIKNFFEEFIPPGQKPKSIREETSRMDLETLREFSDKGREGFVMISEQFLLDSVYDDGKEMKVEQRLSQAKAENTRVFSGDTEMSIADLLALMKEDADEHKASIIANGDNWYKTYTYLIYDAKNNTLTYDINLNDFDSVNDTPIESEASRKLRAEQINWQIRWQNKQNKKK
jgi:hypothetical protein